MKIDETLLRSVIPYIKPALTELNEKQRDFLADHATEEIGEIMVMHALGAAAAGLGSAWIPGAGGVASLMAAVGFIWSMYYRINKCLGLNLTKTLLKSLASAVITNIAAGAVSIIVGATASTLLSFVPGIGSVAAAIVMAGIDYGMVLASGIVYIKLLTNLFKAGRNPSEMNEDQLKQAVKTTVNQVDVNKIIKNSKTVYASARKSGSVSGNESYDIEQD